MVEYRVTSYFHGRHNLAFMRHPPTIQGTKHYVFALCVPGCGGTGPRIEYRVTVTGGCVLCAILSSHGPGLNYSVPTTTEL